MDYVQRLREIHERGERIDPSTYIDIVRRALRLAPADARELLQQTYEKGLQEAYSSRQDGALAKVAAMGGAQLNAVGEHAGAFARLEQALQMATEDASSRSIILGERAVYEALSARPSSATQTRSEAQAAVPAEPDGETAISVQTSSAMVSLVLLEPNSTEAAASAISAARARDFDWMASATMVLLVAVLAASDDENQAIAWADALHGYAASLPHEARQLDATVAQLALRARRGLVDLPDELDEIGHRTINTNALWRLHVLKLYMGVMSGDATATAQAIAEVEGLASQVHGGFAVAREGFQAFADAHFGSGPSPEVTAPGTPSVLMLSATLASAEAVAIAGSQSVVADWLRWFETDLPPGVATSLEWPSCRRRVEGLLLLRLGRERDAVQHLQDGIRCCDERRNAIQSAIGRVQLAEALLRGSTASMLPATHARSLRQSGADELRALGVDPIPFAYAASRTFLREEQIPERGGLTPREAQVLGRLAKGMAYLAKGMAYKEIGSDLGINPRTVGVHASHCYEKLGVRNRVEAVKLAQELGIV